ncbi:MAG: hypothetical protein HYY96_02660 [Candidatus Tectomicrobia bacterium]|nr:hypothetical protein [Candidatus Tectomicrobia bacterium]
MSGESAKIGMKPSCLGAFVRAEIHDEFGLSVSRAAGVQPRAGSPAAVWREQKKGNDLFRYGIDPATFIDQIMIDPRCSQDEFKKLKIDRQRRTTFPGLVMKSRLYAPPPRCVIPVGGIGLAESLWYDAVETLIGG